MPLRRSEETTSSPLVPLSSRPCFCETNPNRDVRKVSLLARSIGSLQSRGGSSQPCDGPYKKISNDQTGMVPQRLPQRHKLDSVGHWGIKVSDKLWDLYQDAKGEWDHLAQPWNEKHDRETYSERLLAWTTASDGEITEHADRVMENFRERGNWRVKDNTCQDYSRELGSNFDFAGQFSVVNKDGNWASAAAT